jgi:hypothetical protein
MYCFVRLEEHGYMNYKPRQLLAKTMFFVWAKLFVRLLALVASIVVLIFWFQATTVGVGTVLGIIALMFVIHFVIVRLIGYGFRVGHIAVITETIRNGKVPRGQFGFGMREVKGRIGTVFTFFFINKLIDKAVKQLANQIRRLTSGLAPGLGALVTFGKGIIKIALKYVDECCVAWIFWNGKEQSSWKSAIDGVTIYAQNLPLVLKNAFKTGLLVILLSIVLYAAMIFIAWGILVLSGVADGGLISSIRSIFSDPLTAVGDIYIEDYIVAHIDDFPWNELWWLVGLYIGFQVAVAIKQAFIDSWMMIRTVVMFFGFAPTTQIRFDTHERLCQVSPAFRQLSDKARLRGSFDTAPNNFAPNDLGAKCGVCGAAVIGKFCHGCGRQQ